nr:type I polyketide synthase [Cellulosilyticum ruminicola]
MSIRNGECDTAIVAGVNLMVTPDNYNSMIESGMIAKDGHCYAFDKRANGMMPAEAVAVVILKKLSKAEKDHNPIYGTIIGSGINYDGKTNGITAPSRYAQSKLLKEVYNNFKIAPRNISYIVTHGTGTRLGDPIEINALADTFEEYTKDTKFCAITSTKSNLGHALAASGVVSLISLIMAIKKGIIPPSIHCEEPNDYIQWEDSPFYINTKASKWEDSEEQERIGAVSAFGMSGTNVHVVVKSNSKYGESRNKMVQAIQCPAYLLAFSAKTEQALIRKANELADLIENHPNEQSLAEISYTLMDGRIQFNHRCAFVVENKEDAIKALRDFSNDRDTAKGFKGIVERDFTPQETITQSIEALIKRLDLQVANKYYEALEALAKFYCMGYKISSTQLFGSNIPYKVSLPTYPFEKEVYWAEAKNVMSQGVVISQQLHPLLHRNTSDLVEQRYTSVFNGEEFFLRDHVVNGNKVLPGVAYLEMIRAAVQQATTNDLTNFVPIKISNVGWFQPIAVQNTNKEVNIALYEDKDNELSYEIYTEDDSIHSQGKANVIQEVNNEVRNFDELKARCSQLISNKQCYDAFRKMKMNYGITYTSIQEVYVGKGEAFAKIAIPESLVDTNKTYVLHPSLLDGALQSIIGLGISSDEGQQTPRVPFAMESLEIYKPADETMWAVIKDNSTSDRVLKHDIDLCNEAGEVCIRIKGYTSRVLNENSLAAKVQLMAINWQEQSLETRAATNEMTNYYVAFCGINHLIEDKVYAALGANVPSQSMMLDRQGEIADHAIEAYSLQLFDKIKEILLDKSIQKACMQVVVVHSGSDKIETA